MAKAITQIEPPRQDPGEERALSLEQLLQTVVQHQEALSVTMDILGELHRAGILEIAQGLLKNREEVGAIAINQLNQPEAHRMIKNGMAGLQWLGRIDPDQLHSVAQAAENGMEQALEARDGHKPIGLWELARQARDPEVRTSLGMLTRFLQGMGKAVRSQSEDRGERR
ncbi:MAG: DUF1641 domain-containing protein [Firmicutes bacterium]|uniref:Uncharacterized conserved protein YjgD, DUF1641 family n=1 Tax=Melghirimyces thermohalophilus TaxID=1236220 RepID=A0A1G6L4X6_9BACL|nr:DUF1641 domain-containing protein [Melghirimyces thermohalophilus]MDA8353140.1 DUF1641 domain-containing protein [Bacillota bacterium]SDC38173.1 Uncharacterized conserved protein YjgD, DUF1641 family [Melghirimyces thermohalophilus]